MKENINAFLFLGKINETLSRVCVCLRKDNKWDESSVFYIDDSFEDAEKELSDKHLSVIFASYLLDKEGDGFTIEQYNNLKIEDSDKTIEDLYHENKFFEIVENGYQKIISGNN